MLGGESGGRKMKVKEWLAATKAFGLMPLWWMGFVAAVLKVVSVSLYTPLMMSLQQGAGNYVMLMLLIVTLTVANIWCVRWLQIMKVEKQFEVEGVQTSRCLAVLEHIDGRRYDDGGEGELLTLLTNDAKQFARLMSDTLPTIGLGWINFIGAVLFGLWKSWQLTLVILVIASLTVTLSRYLSVQLVDQKYEEQESVEALNPILLQLLKSATLLRVFNALPFAIRLFEGAQDNFRNKQLQRKRVSLLLVALSVGTGFILTTTWMTVALFLIQQGQLEVGDFLGFLVLDSQFTWVFFTFPTVYANVIEESVSTERLAAYQSDVKSNVVDVTMYNEIYLENVAFSYDNTTNVFEDINLQIHQGDKYLIAGESGSGKSTLLKLLTGYYRPTQGKIYLMESGKQVDAERLPFAVAYVPQQNIVFSISLYENIVFDRIVAEDTLQWIIRKAGLETLIARLPQGLQTVIESGVFQNLSEGEIQRIGFARALAQQKQFLVVDEPTAALDEANEKLLTTYLAETEQVVILVTHRQTSVPASFTIYAISDHYR